jgi:hypothetical protein
MKWARGSCVASSPRDLRDLSQIFVAQLRFAGNELTAQIMQLPVELELRGTQCLFCFILLDGLGRDLCQAP